MRNPADEPSAAETQASAEALFADLPAFDVVDGELLPRVRRRLPGR